MVCGVISSTVDSTVQQMLEFLLILVEAMLKTIIAINLTLKCFMLARFSNYRYIYGDIRFSTFQLFLYTCTYIFMIEPFPSSQSKNKYKNHT